MHFFWPLGGFQRVIGSFGITATEEGTQRIGLLSNESSICHIYLLCAIWSWHIISIITSQRYGWEEVLDLHLVCEGTGPWPFRLAGGGAGLMTEQFTGLQQHWPTRVEWEGGPAGTSQPAHTHGRGTGTEAQLDSSWALGLFLRCLNPRKPSHSTEV